MVFFRKKYAWAILFSLLLTCYTTYVALDTFVIERVYSAAQTGGDTAPHASASPESENLNTDASTAEAKSGRPNKADFVPSATTEAVVTGSSYADPNISISIAEYRENDTTIYVADIQVSSPEYLKTALAQNIYGKNVTEKTSVIAEENGAILAINGDFYGSQTKGYVLKNGVLYRDTAENGQEDLVIWSDGTFEIITENNTSASELLEKGAVDILSFGPSLVEAGNISVTKGDEVGKAKVSNPRTAIGIIDDLHYVFVVSDGRTSDSSGLSLYQLAEFMQGLGAETAYNLDGGGSSTMVFNGKVVNNPTTSGNRITERSVSDIVYIGH